MLLLSPLRFEADLEVPIGASGNVSLAGALSYQTSDDHRFAPAKISSQASAVSPTWYISGGGSGELDNEHISEGDSGRDPDAAPVALRCPANDRQTKSASLNLAATRGRTPVKPLEHALALRMANGRSAVGNANLGCGSARGHLDPRTTPLGRKLDRVFNEVGKDLVNQVLIADTLNSAASADFEPYVTSLGWALKRANRLRDDFVEINESIIDSRFRSLRLGEEGQVPDESRKMNTLTCDRPERVAIFRNAAIPGESQFRFTADHGDRRSKFVGGVLNKPFHL